MIETIVLILVIIITTFRPLCPPAFFLDFFFLTYCRNFGKELVILFHRSAAAPWVTWRPLLKKRAPQEILSLLVPLPTTVSSRSIVAALDGIRILVPSTTRDPRAKNARAEFKGTGLTDS